jgi:hypothetical protein
MSHGRLVCATARGKYPTLHASEVGARRADAAEVICRVLAIVLSVAAFAQVSLAEDVVGGDPNQDTINAKDLQNYFAPYVPAVRDCYVVNSTGRGGTLRLDLVIHPEGHVFRFAFTATGVAGVKLGKLDVCLRRLSKDWHFPYRKKFTSAVLPFTFRGVK